RVFRAHRDHEVKASSFLLVIMLLLMIILVRICSFLLTQELRSPGKSLQHSHKHVNYSNESFFCGNNSLYSDELSHHKHVETCSALKGGTTSDFIRELPISLGNIERQTRRRAIDLVFCSCLRSNVAEQLSNPVGESNRF